MASLRKTKPFTPDAQSTRFLYLILKQLDLKSVNWQDVADNIGIKNGHAARMRWSRFKQHAEGTPPQSKTPKPKKTDAEKNGKRDRENPGDIMRADDDRDEKRVKLEHGLPMPNGLSPYNGFPHLHYPMPMPLAMPQPPPPIVKTEPSVKQEPGIELSRDHALPNGLPSERPHWQPQHLPSTNAAPPPGFANLFAPDDDTDDVPIRQLVNSYQATVSMAEPQLNSPVKAEPDAPIGPSPTIGTVSGSPSIELSGADGARLSPASVSPPTPPSRKPGTPQVEAQPAPPVDGKIRRPIPTPLANSPEPTAMPVQGPTWFPSPPGAFQPTTPAYYPAFPAGHRPQQYPHPYQSPYGHQQPHPMSYLQRPIIHPFSHMGFHSTPAAPFPHHPLPHPHLSMQSTYPSMPHAIPRDASPSTEDRLRPSTSVQAPRHQADQEVQGATEIDQQERPAADSPKEQRADHATTTQELNESRRPTGVELTSPPEAARLEQPERTSPFQAQLETATSEVVNPTPCVSTTPIPAPTQPAPSSTDLVQPSFVPVTQAQAATQLQAAPPTIPAAAAAGGGAALHRPDQALARAPAPWWPYLQPPSVFPPATFQHSPQTAPAATACNTISLPFAQIPSENTYANSVDDFGFDFDFDFSAIEDDLRLPFQGLGQAEAQVPMEPQFLVAEGHASGEHGRTVVEDT